LTPIPTRLTSAAETALFGERLRTAAVLAVVAAIAVASAADALRGGGSSPPHSHTAPPPPVRLPAPPRGALTGTLWYADADCRLHRIDLATGRDLLVTRSVGHCRFWVSPDRRYVAMHSGGPFTPPRDLELLDVATGRITTPFHRPDLAFSPPAWSADSRALAVCDGSHGPPAILVDHLATGRVTTPARNACFPAYVGGRLAYRDLDSVTHLGHRLVADSGSLGQLLRRGVYQEPAPVGTGDTLAVSATTVTPAGGPPPITTVVLFNGAGKATLRWDTGGIADTISLLANGRIIAAARRAGLMLDDIDTGDLLTTAAGQPIVAATTQPGHPDMVALADGRRIVFETMSGQSHWALPIRTAYLQWTPTPP